MPVQELERSHLSTPTNLAKDFIPLSPDRILPVTEPQETRENDKPPTVFPSSGSISFNRDLEYIARLHAEFGIREGQRLSHDPVLERARYERAATDEERQAVRQGVVTNTEKTLYERAHVSQSTVLYYQDNEGRIYNPGFPGESFDVVLQRGLEYSRSAGFVDYERELEEYEGWKEVMAVLFDRRTPQKSKAVVISGRGLKKGTAFTDNFVDIYTKAKDSATGKVIVIMTRFASEANYSENRKTVVRLDSQYFNSEKILTDEDAEFYFIRHPVFIDSADPRNARQIFETEFKKQKGVAEEEKTKHYLEGCQLFILHYAETVCSRFFDPERVKIAFNAAINKFDSLRKDLIKTVSHTVNKAAVFFKSIYEEIDYYGRKQVEKVMVGCGLSGGFSLGGSLGKVINAVNGLISRIKERLGGSDQYGSLEFECPKCGEVNRRPKGQLIPTCQYCNADVRC